MPQPTPHSVSLRFLQSHALFGGISDERLIYILSLMKQENRAAGEEIITEGTNGDSLYLIVQGAVEVLKRVPNDGGGKEPPRELLASLVQGDTFGEMALIDLQERSASVRAVEETTLLSLSQKDLLKIAQDDLENYTIILLNLAREISRRLRTVDAGYATSLFSIRQS